MRRALRWLAGVGAGVAVFEGVDVLGSTPGVIDRFPEAASLPVVSPLLAGMTAAWGCGGAIVPPLLAAAAAVWGRIAVDRAIGIVRGAHFPPEFGLALILAFGVPWTVEALVGGCGVILARWALRRWTRTSG